MIRFVLIIFLFLMSSCFFRETVVDYAIDGCDKFKTFCTVGSVYDQDEIDDTIVPYHRSFIFKIKNNAEYGIFMPKGARERTLASEVSLVDENDSLVALHVTLKNEDKMFVLDLDKVSFESDGPEFFIEVQTPSIPSYEIDFKFEKKDGTVHVFSFKMNQERKKQWFFILSEI